MPKSLDDRIESTAHDAVWNENAAKRTIEMVIRDISDGEMREVEEKFRQIRAQCLRAAWSLHQLRMLQNIKEAKRD